MADSIKHIAINVSNISDAVAWYTTSFSCEVLSSSSSRAVLRFDNCELVLTLPSAERPHLAFTKSDAETYGELRDHGDGAPSTLVSDSTGNMVKLFSV